MTFRELDDLLWRSCYLGMRLGSPPNAWERLGDDVRRLGEIARGELTLSEPNYTQFGSDPQLARFMIGLVNGGANADREIATRIVAGFDAATRSEAADSDAPILHADLPPVRIEEGDVLKVGRGRVSLDLVVDLYKRGRTPEQIVEDYDALNLPDVYGVIAYYLRHREEVDAYIARRKAAADALQAEIEAEHPRISRSELLARRAAAESAHAPVRQ